MPQRREWTETDDQGADRQTASLAGLAAALAVVVLALLVVRELHSKMALEDCLISGRSDCVDLVAATSPEP